MNFWRFWNCGFCSASIGLVGVILKLLTRSRYSLDNNQNVVTAIQKKKKPWTCPMNLIKIITLSKNQRLNKWINNIFFCWEMLWCQLIVEPIILRSDSIYISIHQSKIRYLCSAEISIFSSALRNITFFIVTQPLFVFEVAQFINRGILEVSHFKFHLFEILLKNYIIPFV